jgi:hypothetical protein
MSDQELVTFDSKQFARLDLQLGAIGNALWEINDKLIPIDNAINAQTVEITKWQSIQNESIIAGFALVAEAIAHLQPLPPVQPKLKGRFTLILKNNQPDFGYDFDVSGITDEEGEAITDEAVLAGVVKEVSSDNSGVVSATPADEGGAGTCHVGTSGAAVLSGKAWLSQADKDAGKDPAFLATEVFTITTSNPAAITEGGFKFDIESGGTPAVES